MYILYTNFLKDFENRILKFLKFSKTNFNLVCKTEMGNSESIFDGSAGIQNIKALCQVLSGYLSPMDLLSLSKTCKFASTYIAKVVLTKTRENLIPLLAEIFNYSQQQAKGFVDEVSEDVFFFGSTLVLALISVDTKNPANRAFKVNDLDMICVLPEFAPTPKVVYHSRYFGERYDRIDVAFRADGYDDSEALLHNICSRYYKNDYNKKSHIEFHEQPMMYFPGETCATLRRQKKISHPYLRQWFAEMNMEARELYQPETSGFFQQSTNIVVASPHKADDEKSICDIVFLQLPIRKSESKFAWDHILTSPFTMGQVCYGMRNGKLSLSVKNLDILQKRVCIVQPGSGLPQFEGMIQTKSFRKPQKDTTKSNVLNRMVFEYLLKYVDRGICNVTLQFDLDCRHSTNNMSRAMKITESKKVYKMKRTPEKDGITEITISL